MAAASADFLYAFTLPLLQHGQTSQHSNEEAFNDYNDCRVEDAEAREDPSEAFLNPVLKPVVDNSSPLSTSYEGPIEVVLYEDDLSLADTVSVCPYQPPPSHLLHRENLLLGNQSNINQTGKAVDEKNRRQEENEEGKMITKERSESRKDPLEPLQGCRRVHFGHVEIREYSITVGDHPSCKDSCPLTLEWKHTASVKKNISQHDDSTPECHEDEYKSQRENCRRPSSPTLSSTKTSNPGERSLSPPLLPRRLSLLERRQRIANVRGVEESSQAILDLELLRARESFERDHPRLMAIQRQRQRQRCVNPPSSDIHASKGTALDCVALHRVGRHPLRKNKLCHDHHGRRSGHHDYAFAIKNSRPQLAPCNNSPSWLKSAATCYSAAILYQL